MSLMRSNVFALFILLLLTSISPVIGGYSDIQRTFTSDKSCPFAIATLKHLITKNCPSAALFPCACDIYQNRLSSINGELTVVAQKKTMEELCTYYLIERAVHDDILCRLISRCTSTPFRGMECGYDVQQNVLWTLGQ